MISDALHIALDPIFSSDVCEFSENRFVLVFNRGKQRLQIIETVEIMQSDGENNESDAEAN